MALSNSTFGDLGTAVSDFGAYEGTKYAAAGDLMEAQEYDLAADLATQNEKYTQMSTAIKEQQEQREITMATGTTRADVAGAGFSRSGSALDILRDSAAQGALTKAVTSEQGLITEAGYKEQAQSYDLMASAATNAASAEKTAGTFDLIGAGISAAAAVGSLFTGGAAGAVGDGGASMLAAMPTDL